MLHRRRTRIRIVDPRANVLGGEARRSRDRLISPNPPFDVACKVSHYLVEKMFWPRFNSVANFFSRLSSNIRGRAAATVGDALGPRTGVNPR